MIYRYYFNLNLIIELNKKGFFILFFIRNLRGFLELDYKEVSYVWLVLNFVMWSDFGSIDIILNI